MKKHWDFLESRISTSGGDWFCGSLLTGADILLIFPIESALLGGVLDGVKYPKLKAFVAKVHEREAYKKAVARVEKETGEKFSIAPGM